MASSTSLGSLPFLLETNVDSLVLLDTRSSYHSPQVPGRVCGVKGSCFEHSERLGLCWRKRVLWKSKKVRAIASKSFGMDEYEDGSKDVVHATIEKNKKVLALQRDLLQQISERKELISSIDAENISKPEGGDISYERCTNGRSHSFEKQNGGFDESKADVRFPSPEPATLRLESLPPFFTNGAENSSIKVKNQDGMIESSLKKITDESSEIGSEGEIPQPLAGTNVMNVIVVAAECAPWSKTGGLGDVAGSLPKALAKRGHRVMVVAPRYGNYVEPQDTGVRKTFRVDDHDMEVRYFQAYIDGVDFGRLGSAVSSLTVEFEVVGSNSLSTKVGDILKRMILFCKAAVEVPWHVPCGGVCYGDGNLAFIANDWHTSLLPVYLKAYYRDQGLMKYARSVLVIHNIAHQGRGPVDDFSYVDLPEHYTDLFKLYDPIGGDHFNIFAAGLKTADRVVTVSHGYSWELKTSDGGWGLHGIINDNQWKLRGIVNGIDNKDWNPQFDVHLKSDGYTNYSLETLHTGKAQCKAALQKELGLPVRKDVPVIGFIGRLDPQKGVDLIAEAIPWMMGQDVQLIMLGSGRPDLEQMLRNFENQHNDKIRSWVGFSVKTAHRITAGADILLMPSRFEPCGLNQLYAMAYGTVPVVHAVGGLRDTVKPFDPFNETGLGWTFESAESGKLIHALGNCLLTYREYKKSWEGLQQRGMKQDLSWDNAAQQYEEVLLAAKYQW
ncbi:hypothetical protein PIB30_009605 [Stylosanthes scabra]|uniref:Starch synthase catalytic domain-containing protein n=1 Tax=Stylosanthes scabra TaxID=79078 RepID=A0ABU6R467_9FABA|nr:hypothetical protein [Stylosanthes scabra]